MTMRGPGWTVGIDLGGTFIKSALLSPDGEIAARERIPTGGHDGPDAVLARIAECIARMVAAAPERVIGVGVGVPGMVDMETGVTGDVPNLPGRWRDIPVAATLSSATGLPVRLINDASAFVVAEMGLGAAAGVDTGLCVTVGTGIGGGIIAHGRPVFGLGGASGEIGHLIVQPGGVACSCGNRGCVEPLATGPAIAAEAVRRCVQGFSTRLPEFVGGDLNRMTPEIVDEAAQAGDEFAIQVLEDAGRWLGWALAGAIAFLAPEVVVIGGGVARPGGHYWNEAVATARGNVHTCEIELVRFEPAALGYDAGVIGAALWGATGTTASVRSTPEVCRRIL
jgi:glucokinase